MKLESITASELSRQMPQLTESLQQGDVRYRIIRNSQHVGMLVGMKDPAIKILEIETSPSDLQCLEFQFRTVYPRHGETFMEENGGIVPAEGFHWIDRLVGLEGSDLMRELPAKDHCTLWLKNGKPELFTMEVYSLAIVRFVIGYYRAQVG
jgi:hypothetical protein